MELRTFQWFVFYFSSALSIGYAMYIVKKLEMCDKNFNYSIQVHIKLRMINDKQLISANITLGVPFDDSVRVHFTIEMLSSKNEVTHLFSRDEVNACTTGHKYFGEFAYDIERRVRLIPGMCPIPKGKYDLHDYPLNLDLIPVQGLPFGNLRFQTNVMKGSDVLVCTELVLENRECNSCFG